jgi:hypothetical protein
MGRNDIQNCRPRHDIRMIERHAVGDSRPAIVSDDGEPLEPEVLHDLHLIQRHGALGVVHMVRSALGLAAITVSPEIGGNDGVRLGQFRGNFVPDGVRLRGAVQKQQRWAPASDDNVDRRP